MGVGGILLGAALCSRTATGIEIERKWIDIYSEVCKKENIPLLETIHGDATSVFDTFQGRNYDCIFTDVPYFTMDTAPRSRGKFKKTGEAAKEAPRSKLSRFNTIQYRTKEEWLNGMREIFEKAVRYLKSGGYCLVFIGDMYFRNEYHCLSAELAWELKKIAGLVWKANIIWYDVSKKLHLYGYQYAYIPSMIHQNIIILRKEL
jgi:tRNA G10  N-methylase Trm11